MFLNTIIKCKGGTSLLIIILFLATSVQQLWGQCAITVSAVQASESSCQANGVIQATLSGADVALINLAQVKFTITSPSFTSTPSANGGTIVAVPPGTYTVTAEYLCPLSNTIEKATSATVVMVGTYPGFDSQKVYVMTAGILSSLKCLPTGSAPIHVEGGRTPYTATITTAPAPAYVGKIYTLASAGTLLMDNLPAGTYWFDFTDGCYTVPRSFTIPELPVSLLVSKVTPSSVCNPKGSITLDASNSSSPYAIKMTSYPDIYKGPYEFTSLTVPYTIENLPSGNYSLTVNDACSEKTLTPTIPELPPSAGVGASMNTDCSGKGSITFDFTGGEPPYQLSMTAPVAKDYPLQNAGLYTVTDLVPGTYTFALKDKCGTNTYTYTQDLSTSSLKVQLVSPPALAAHCKATSAAIINLDKGAPPYSGTFLKHPSGIPQASIPGLGNGNHTLSDLPVGNYEVEYTDKCGAKNTVEFEIEAEPLDVDATLKASLNCGAGTGSAKLIISSGLAPYDVTIEGVNPVSPLQTISPTPLTDNVFNIQGLPPGDYLVTVKDDCGSIVTKPITIIPINVGGVSGIDIKNPMLEFFQKPTNSGPQCDTVRLLRDLKPAEAAADPDFKEYWVDHPNDYFEMAFQENGGVLSNWGPVVDVKDTVFTDLANSPATQSYCVARSVGREFYVFFRLKDAACPAAMEDTVKFAPLKTNITGPTNESCSGSDFTFTHPNTENGLFCYPFKWELMDKNNVSILPGPSVALHTAGPHTISGVKKGAYRVKFTDASNCTWYADWLNPATGIEEDSIRVDWSNPSEPTLKTLNFTCTQYDFTFVDTKVCLPYQWELKTKGGTTIVPKTEVNNHLDQSEKGLIYDTTYILTIYKDGQSKPYEIKETGISKPVYLASGNHSFCLPDTAYGAIKITRTGNAPFEKGSIIRFHSGPSIPSVDSYLIPTDNVRQIFPFSASDASTEQFVDLLPGVYEFEVEDTCGVKTIVPYTYERAVVRDFKLTSKPGCGGTLIKPSGSLYIGNTAVNTYFSAFSAPTGVALPTEIASGVNAGYYLLSHSGDFVFQISHTNGAGACPYDTIRYTNVHKTFGLDVDSTTAFKCNDDSDGLFSVRQKNGIGPFLYSLYDDSGQLVGGPKATGDFRVPNAVGGTNYTFKIEDQGCNISFKEPIQMINLSDLGLVPKDFELCAQADLYLTASTLGKNPTFNWTGPNGFNSVLQNPVRPSMTTADSGIYLVEIHPVGCIDPVKQSIRIGVVDPSKPLPPDTVLCQDTPDFTLDITPDPGYRIKWYADANDPLTNAISPPVLSTAMPTDFVFYAIQEHLALGCKSEKQAVNVKVSDRPSSDIIAFAPDICLGSTAQLFVADSKSDHQYVLYNKDDSELIKIKGNGDTISLAANEVLQANETYAIETRNQYACPSVTKKEVTVEVIDVGTLVQMPDVDVCIHSDLQLNSGSLGTTTKWTWTGPNAFSDTAQNPLRANVTLADVGVYKLDIQSVCPVIRQEVKVGVIDPPKPTPPDTVFCQNGSSATLDITPDPGYQIKWYANLNDDVNTAPTITAPTPPTGTVGDQVYYAIQEYIALGCKSEKQEVNVKISDRPSSDIIAFAPDICLGSTAQLFVADSKSDHQYVLYNKDDSELIKIKGNGDTISLAANEVLQANETYAIETRNQYACPSVTKKEVTVEVIDVGTLVQMPDVDVCIHSDLQLNSGSLGTTTKWTWTGPNAFSDTVQNPLRANVTLADVGVYKLAIQSVCPVIRQEIKVGVIDPPKPTPPDTVFCQNGSSTTLDITPDPGYQIKWYANLNDDVNTAPTITAPTPPTGTVGDQLYYAIQEHIALGCKSEKQEVKVKISDLPSSDIHAFAPDICPGITATVLVVDSDVRYIYKLYDVATAGTAIEQLAGNGDTLTFHPNEILNTDTPYYIEIVNTYACVSADRKTSTAHIVDYLEMGPEKLPQYQRGKYYDQQLTTNAHAPYVFSTSDLLPSGLSLAAQGAITGTPPRNGRIDPAEFLVQVEDKDGCIKEQLYILKSEIFIPQVLTPNGDGKNDHFMRGHKLIIFDRLGIIVFEGEDGWDGTIDGKTAPADTYFYLLFFEDDDTGKESQKKGFITLIR